MDLRKLKKLIDLVQDSGIAELEITEGEEKVRITSKLAGQTMYAAPQMMAAPQPAAPSASVAVAVEAEPAQPEEPYRQITDGGHFLSNAFTHGEAVRRSRAIGQGWRDLVHHRGDEIDERDRIRCRRRRQSHPDRKRSACGIRSAAVHYWVKSEG